MINIDNLDLQIISELLDDSTVSVPQLAKKWNVGRKVIYTRIQKLVKKNMIKRFTIVVNDEELGYPVKAMIGITIDLKKRDKIMDEIFRIKEIKEVTEVVGKFHIMVTVYAKSLNHMYSIASEKIKGVQGVESLEPFIQVNTRSKKMPYILLRSEK